MGKRDGAGSPRLEKGEEEGRSRSAMLLGYFGEKSQRPPWRREARRAPLSLVQESTGQSVA